MRARLRATGPSGCILLVLCAGLIAACGGLETVEAGRIGGEPSAPAWSLSETRRHVRVLESSDAGGRGTATAGLAFAAEYTAGQLRLFGIQPILADSYRHLYYAPIHHVADARVVTLAADTVVTAAGLELVPDGRSALGTMTANTVWFPPDTLVGPAPAPLAVLPVATSDARMEALARLGVRGALIAGPPTPRRSSAPFDQVLVVRTSIPLTARLLGLGRDLPMESGVRALPHSLRLDVAGATDPLAASVNVAGYVPGGHPVRRSELVVIAVALDGPGSPGGVRLPPDPARAIAPSAVLEVARVVARQAFEGRRPERSVMVLFFSGGEQALSGWRAVAESPPWPGDAVVKVALVVPDCPGAMGSWPVPACFWPEPGADGPGIRAAALGRSLFEAVAPHAWLQTPPKLP